jgi:NADH:ubiquinone oxidoreductase subunit 5 (subunit L)/multisubunit Na+/H+ antiporter MnhA subunit
MTSLVYPTIVLVLFLLAKVVPHKHSVGHLKIDFATLRNKYQKWDILSGILLLILIPGMAYLIGLLFSTIFYSPENKVPGIIYHIATSRLMWFMPGLVLSFALIRFPMTFIYKLILKEDYDEFMLYSDLKTGADGVKILSYMMWISGIGAALLLILLSDYSVNIYKDKIVLNDFLTFTDKTYSFSEIESINHIKPLNPNTGEPEKPSYFIRFKDKGHWDTNRGLEDDNNKQEEIINYLSEKTKLKINVLEANLE